MTLMKSSTCCTKKFFSTTVERFFEYRNFKIFNSCFVDICGNYRSILYILNPMNPLIFSPKKIAAKLLYSCFRLCLCLSSADLLHFQCSKSCLKYPTVAPTFHSNF